MELTEFWKTLVPLQFVPLTKCHCVIKKHLSKSSNVEIVICTVHGQVLEFSGCQIVGSCEISCFDPESITIFTTYDFKCNIFYIIKSGNRIIIVSRERGLEVMKQYQHVGKFMVSDFSNVGFPQLGIWTENAMDSSTPNKIVDLKSCVNTGSDDCNISSILHEKYQELTMKVEEYEHKLKMKKDLRMYNCEMASHGNKFPFSSGSVLVPLVSQGEWRDLAQEKHINNESAVKVAETWQKIHNGKWVVGISICNSGKRDLLNLQLILRCSSKEELTYMTKLLMYNCDEESPPMRKRSKFSERSCSGLAAWNEVTVLKPGRKAVLTGVLEAPKFVEKAVAIVTGVVTYKFDKEPTIGHQVPISSFQYRVEDFSRRLGSPFTSDITETDQLCVLMSSYTVTLPVVYASNFETPLQKILVDELKFIEFPSIGCLFHKGTTFTELAGIMLLVETVAHLKYSLTVCARNVQQLYLLAHCMYSVLFAPHMVLYPPKLQDKSQPDGANIWKHQHKEFELVLNKLKPMVTKMEHRKSDIMMPWEEFSAFRSQLSELEMETDIAFLGIK